MFKRNHLFVGVALATCSATLSAFEIEEVVVTATKQSASTQDIPVAVNAIGEEALDNLGISDFSDYLVQMPGVTAGGGGPGQNTIYIRGVASTTPNLTSSGVAGLAPNVALYLDEQPLSQPGRNLDVYAADLARVEVLAGPQGTLFGASSQAGTVRLITNKPDPSGFSGKVKFGTAWTENGEPSNNVEGVVNMPLTDSLTARAVVYVDNQGGYIDNVAGTRSVAQSARFRSGDTVRSNGVPVGSSSAGFQAGQDLSAVNFIEANNSSRTEDDFNEATYSGTRISALWEINENWDLLVGVAQQTLDSEGVFFVDPDLDDLEIQRFEQDTLEDEFTNANWTLTGQVGDLEMVYTGAFTKREADQLIDYTDYLFVGQYIPYYICDSSVAYPGAGTSPTGTCQAPNLFVDSNVKSEFQTHEIRFSTDQSKSIRATFGGFFSDSQLEEDNMFVYPGSVAYGFADNTSFTTGHVSDRGVYPEGTIFRNDILRTDQQYGAFGEITVDLSDHFSATVGARWYDIEVDIEGSANGSFCNKGSDTDANSFGADISDLFNGDGQYTFIGSCGENITFTDETAVPGNADFDSLSASQQTTVLNGLSAPDTASTDGFIGKFTFSWTPNDNALFYVTWSEGFRPGFLNRPGGATSPDGSFTVPFSIDTDEVTNYEFGWKTDFTGANLRFNGSVFEIDVDRLQISVFEPTISNLFFAANGANARIRGFEGDFIWLPNAIEGLSLSGGVSHLDTEIRDVLLPTDAVTDGNPLAFAPDFQFNLQARYEWEVSNGNTAHVMPYVTYSDEVYTDIININRLKLDSWAMFGITAGLSNNEWTAELYVENLTDERAEISGNFNFDRSRVTVSRPRTLGLRFSYNFN